MVFLQSIQPDTGCSCPAMVERPSIFTMDDLVRFPSTSRVVFIECSGNSAPNGTVLTGRTVQEAHGLPSASEWTGVPLATVLAETGIKPEAAWMLAEGSEAAAMTRNLPLPAVLEETLLCYAQNGEAWRAEQGFRSVWSFQLGRQHRHQVAASPETGHRTVHDP